MDISHLNLSSLNENQWKRSFFALLAVFLYLIIPQYAAKELPDLSKIPTPPSFIHQSNPTNLYFVVEDTRENDAASSAREKKFNCEATGFPKVNYRWLKDKKEMNISELISTGRLTKIPGTGSIILSKLQKSDAGEYQCLADNDNGTAVDKPIYFEQSLMELFPPEPVETIRIEFGNSFHRECVAPMSIPAARPYWVLLSLPGTDRRTFRTINSTNVVVNDKGTIFFQYVTDKDIIPSLYYTCMAENLELKDYKFGSQLTFEVVPTPHRKTLEPSIPPLEQYTSPDKITILKGENLELFCVFSGFPDMKPRWSKDSGTLDFSRVSYGTNFMKSMKLYNVTHSDAGYYACRFPNSPQLDKRFHVIVEESPFWINNEPPRNMNSSRGSTVEFNCSADGTPKPEFKFYKNGEEITQLNPHYVIDGSILKIEDIKRGDRGFGDNAVYQCNATNKHGSVWTNFYLNILEFEPTVLQGPGEVETVVGHNATLSCKVFGSPKPSVEWHNRLLRSGLAGIHYRIEQVDHEGYSRLHLKNVQKSQAGIFECRFNNSMGADSANGKLIVRDRTKFIKVPDNMDNIAAGRRVQIPCEVNHDPELKAQYIWSFYTRPINWTAQDVAAGRSKVHVDPDTHALIINDPSGNETGAYTCEVRTALDSAKHTVTITVKANSSDVPLPPRDVHVKCFNTTAEISFYYRERSKAAAPVESFLIQLNVDPDEYSAWDDYGTEIRTLNNGLGKAVVHLDSYGHFAFRVLAKNEIGSSQPTYPSEYTSEKHDTIQRCQTAAKRPQMSPINVKASGSTPDSLTVSWEPLARRDWSGPNFTYFIQYKAKNEDTFNNITVNNPRADHVTIRDLPTYSEYDVLVWSRNSEGLPLITPIMASGFSGEDIPSEAPEGFNVRDIQGPSTASFFWKPVNASSVRGEFKGYKVEYWYNGRQKRSTAIRKEAYFDSSASEGSIYDLKPNTKNYALIRVYNNAGEGPASPVVEIDMPPGVPGAVQNLQAFTISHQEIATSWSEPLEVNGNLTHYEVEVCLPTEYAASSSLGCLETRTVLANERLEVRFGDLQRSTKYRIQVVAFTTVGPGPVSMAITETTPEINETMKPAQPGISKIQISDNHMNVTWKPGAFFKEDGAPPGNEFFFKYRPVGSDEDWMTVNSTSSGSGNNTGLTLTLKDLQPGVTYEIKAVSVHKGLTTESKPHYYTTTGGQMRSTSAGWVIAFILAVIFLIIVLIIVCLIARSRGAKYPVSKKEKQQGRDNASKNEKAFGEYTRAPEPTDEEKASLTAQSKLESETDSMAEYGDGENGRFTEDGSFIGQYGQKKEASNIQTADKSKASTGF